MLLFCVGSFFGALGGAVAMAFFLVTVAGRPGRVPPVTVDDHPELFDTELGARLEREECLERLAALDLHLRSLTSLRAYRVKARWQ